MELPNTGSIGEVSQGGQENESGGNCKQIPTRCAINPAQAGEEVHKTEIGRCGVETQPGGLFGS